VGSWAPAVVLAWLIPGGGHFLLKRPGRGAVLGISVILVFLLGLMMRGTLFQPLHVMLTAHALRPVIEREFPEQRIGLLRPDNLLLFNFDSAPVNNVIVAGNTARGQ